MGYNTGFAHSKIHAARVKDCVQYTLWMSCRHDTSHSGRRTFITNLAAKGIGVRVLAELAAHSSIATTQRYIDVNDEQLRAAVELAWENSSIAAAQAPPSAAYAASACSRWAQVSGSLRSPSAPVLMRSQQCSEPTPTAGGCRAGLNLKNKFNQYLYDIGSENHAYNIRFRGVKIVSSNITLRRH